MTGRLTCYSQAGPYERIWQSDQLIPASLKADFVSAVAPLESVADTEKDWHPGSDGKVLDLVHPSLYPVIYGRTTARGAQEPLQPPVTDVAAMFRSERFQWLPTDFHVKEDGTVDLVSPYINNIHPEDDKALTDIIPKVMEKAVPMYEWVLSDLARETQVPTRLDLKGHKFPQCIWPDGYEPGPEGDTYARFMSEHTRLQAEDRKGWEADKDKFLDDSRKTFLDTRSSEDEEWQVPSYPEYEEVDYYRRFEEEYLDSAADHQWPDSKPSYCGGLDDVKKTLNLRGKTLQVIVKLANIVLTPEKPEYEGGTWHVEGIIRTTRR